MHKLLKVVVLFVSGFSLTPFIHSQEVVYDQLSMGQGYENMLFYSLENGVVGDAPMAAWDLSFDIRPMGSTVNINCGMGHTLYPFGTIEDWDNASLEGWESPEPYRNNHTSWSSGAFNQGNDPSNDFDLGWGIYDIITHTVNTNRMYLIMLPSGEYKKIAILSLDSGIYTFKYANMDGSEESEVSIEKSSYPGKLNVYYSIQTNEILDLEPADPWDFMAMRYLENLSDEVYYGVTGILLNSGVNVQQKDGLFDPFSDGLYDSALSSDTINTIGHDWKSYSMSLGYSVAEERCYFVSDNPGNIWRVVFTDFDGMSTGNMELGKILESTSRVNQLQEIAFEIYPNPSSFGSQIRASLSDHHNVCIVIRSLSGSLIRTINPTSSNPLIDVTDIPCGVYIIECANGGNRSINKLIIQ